MKKLLTLTAVIAVALLYMAAVATEKEHPGKPLWDKMCASCHGPDGKGNEKIAKMLKLDVTILDMTREEAVKAKDEDLRKIIEDGKGKMPGYKKTKKLNDEQIGQVLAYMRVLEKQAEEAAKGKK